MDWADWVNCAVCGGDDVLFRQEVFLHDSQGQQHVSGKML